MLLLLLSVLSHTTKQWDSFINCSFIGTSMRTKWFQLAKDNKQKMCGSDGKRNCTNQWTRQIKMYGKQWAIFSFELLLIKCLSWFRLVGLLGSTFNGIHRLRVCASIPSASSWYSFVAFVEHAITKCSLKHKSQIDSASNMNGRKLAQPKRTNTPTTETQPEQKDPNENLVHSIRFTLRTTTTGLIHLLTLFICTSDSSYILSGLISPSSMVGKMHIISIGRCLIKNFFDWLLQVKKYFLAFSDC